MTSTRSSPSKPDADNSRSLLTAMLQASPGDWVQILDAGSRCLLAQGQGLAAISANPADLIGKTPQAIYGPDLAGDIAAAGARALAGETLAFECALGDRHYALTVSPLLDPNAVEGRVVLVARDITELKRIENRLEHTAWRLDEVQRIANVGDWEWDPRTDVITWSDELYRILGLNPGEPLPDYQGNLALYPPEDARKLDAAVKAALEQGHPYSLELRRTLPDGREVVTQGRGEVERDATGSIVRLYGTALDITALKEAERKVQTSHQHLLEMLESTTDAFFELDAGFNVVYMNRKAVREIGFESLEAVLGRCLWDLVPQAIDTVFFQEYHRAMREQEAVKLEAFFPPFDAWYEVHVYPSPESLFVYFQVVTERKRTEQQLKVAKETAIAASAAKSAFLANMSHEIRTPLNGVMGMLNLMTMTDLSDEQREYTEQAMSSTRRLTRLLSDILDLSRIEAGHLTLTREPFELAEVLDALQQLFKPAATRKGIELLVSLDPETPRRLIGDATRLHQILGNLVGNAIKFTPQGQVSVEAIALGNGHRGEQPMLFIVKDTGVGMAEEQLDTLFEPFRQVENHYTKQHDGVGLGLSIVKHLIQRMKGSLCVGSKPGRGTEFVVSLPFGEARAAEVAPDMTASAMTGGVAGLRLLLVEDEAVNRIVLVRTLEKQDCSIMTANNGEECLDILRRESFDLVLMDMRMPVMNGIEATGAIRRGEAGEHNRKIPIIALTAFAMPAEKDSFMAAGVDDCATKPIDMARLLNLIGSVLRRPAPSD